MRPPRAVPPQAATTLLRWWGLGSVSDRARVGARYLAAVTFDLKGVVASRLGENYDLHEQYVNPTLVEVFRTIGFDRVYARGEDAYLWDRAGTRYLDMLGGFGVAAVGRNNPVVAGAIRDVLDMDLPNMVQMDCALLSGLLAEAIVQRTPPTSTPCTSVTREPSRWRPPSSLRAPPPGATALHTSPVVGTASPWARCRPWATMSSGRDSGSCWPVTRWPPDGAAPGACSPLSTGVWSPTSSAPARRCRARTCRWRPWCAADPSTRPCSAAWSAAGCTHPVLAATIWPWPPGLPRCMY